MLMKKKTVRVNRVSKSVKKKNTTCSVRVIKKPKRIQTAEGWKRMIIALHQKKTKK